MLGKCDCLNFCGDDPDLYKGTAAPCQTLLNEQARRARAADMANVATLLGQFELLLPENDTFIFELQYSRSVGWQVYIAAGGGGEYEIGLNRKTVAKGQGSTPGVASAGALAMLNALAVLKAATA